MSREHWVSESLLALGGGSVTVQGFPWLEPEEAKRLTTRALAAKVLCTRHNSALSDLDSLATDVFRYLTADPPVDAFRLVHGPDLERWLLKSLCGGVASGNVPRGTERIVDWEPPREWLNVLFRGEQLPSEGGLHYRPVGQPGGQLYLQTAHDSATGDFKAVFVAIGGHLFFLAFDHIPSPRDGNDAPETKRPAVLVVSGDNDKREVHFGWVPPGGPPVHVRQTRDVREG